MATITFSKIYQVSQKNYLFFMIHALQQRARRKMEAQCTLVENFSSTLGHFEIALLTGSLPNNRRLHMQIKFWLHLRQNA